jgi:hypothetical protein
VKNASEYGASEKGEVLKKIDSVVRVLELQISQSSRVLMQLIDFV